MGKRRSAILYIAGGAVGLAIVVLLLRFISNSQYSSRIPEISDYGALSLPVREQISEALAKAQHSPSAGNLGMLGMVYHSSANYGQAAQCYKLAIERGKSGWVWNYYLGYLSIEMGESDAVVENFKSVIDKNPGLDLAWYYIGEEYQNLGKNDLAEKTFDRIKTNKARVAATNETTRVDNFPLGTYAMFQLSRIFFDTGRNSLAEKTLKEIIQSERSFGPAYRLLANIYNKNGDMALGKWYSERAMDLLAFSPPVDTLVDRLVLMSRSELYLLKKIDEAENSIYSDWALRLVKTGLKYMPENKYLVSKAIKTFLWVGLDKQATDLTDQHISYFNDNFSEMNKTGTSFFVKGLYQPAVKYFTRASEIKPEDNDTQKNLAISLSGVGNKQESNEILNKLIKDNRNNPGVLADLTYLLFHLGEREKALGYFSGLKQVSPSNPVVQKMSAEIAEANGEFQKAISLYESSFKGDPKDLKTIRYLGNLLVRQKMWEKSINHYRKALEYHPNEPEFLERLGTLLVTCPDQSLQNIEEGKDYSERAFIHISSRPNTLVVAGKNLSLAYALLGNKQNALSTIRQTINIGRRENIPQAYQAELENLYSKLQKISK